MPMAITKPASIRLAVTGSPSSGTAKVAPKNGATEKYAPVRAVPKDLKARTNKVRLMP